MRNVPRASRAFRAFSSLPAGPVRVSRNGGVAHVTVCRADIHNAFNEEIISGLTSAMVQVSSDPAVRVVVLAGEGASFSAGADINYMRKMATNTKEENAADGLRLRGLFAAVRDCPVPVIARVSGAAYGGGCGLIACSDIAVSIAKAQFAFTEVRLGILPAVISPFVMQKIGTSAASRYFLTAEAFGAPEAMRIGLVSQVVDTELELDAAVTKIADTIVRNSPMGVRSCKRLIQEVNARGADHTNSELTAYTIQCIVDARASEDGREGLKAFLNKTPAPWVPQKKQ